MRLPKMYLAVSRSRSHSSWNESFLLKLEMTKMVIVVVVAVVFFFGGDVCHSKVTKIKFDISIFFHSEVHQLRDPYLE